MQPKTMRDLDIVDLIWQRSPAAFWRVASCCGIHANRKMLINVFREVYYGKVSRVL